MISKTKTVTALVLLMGLAAIAAITLLQERSSSSRDAQLKLAEVRAELHQLQSAPFQASPAVGGSPTRARAMMDSGMRQVRATLRELSADSPPEALRTVPARLDANFGLLERVYAIGAAGRDYGEEADLLGGRAQRIEADVTDQLDVASAEYSERATRADRQATVGSAGAILLLLAAFAYFYARTVRGRATERRLLEENEQLLEATRREARTDSLTNLPNRRALIAELDERAAEGAPAFVALYDLDGFKQYNDSFGHPAGDALLARMGMRLESALDGAGTAYRMGGDEFCVVAPAGDDAERLAEAAASALTERGGAFTITCSFGTATLPEDGSSASDALRVADQRMYSNKGGRASARRQSTDVLLKALSERSPGMSTHMNSVARLAEATAQRLELPRHEVERIALAAELNSIGKLAIPDEILGKPESLDPEEWEFIYRHTEIGERIVREAPALAHTADLVRSSHERHDGGGYPDGLAGDAIPLGSSIIAVCDAYEAMTSGRPYRPRRDRDAALEELRWCAGTQFRPAVVAAFTAVLEAGEPVLRAA